MRQLIKFILSMVNTFYKYAVQPSAPEWRHSAPTFSWLSRRKTFYPALHTNLLLMTDISTIPDDEPQFNKPCGKQRCKVCKHINTATNVYIDHKTIKPGNYNCQSASVVYLIHRKKCPEAHMMKKTGGNSTKFKAAVNSHQQEDSKTTGHLLQHTKENIHVTQCK